MFSPPLSPIESPIIGPRDEGLAEIPSLDSIDSRLKCSSISWDDKVKAGTSENREDWLSAGRGRTGLRIVIVTENFLPKVDGVTRTLARLLEHLEKEGHSCMLLGPGSGMSHYATHPLVGTLGLPLILYPGLKLNFLRPKFMSTIKNFQPDVVHFVDPIWLGAQTLMAMELGWAGEDWVGSTGPRLGGGISGAVVASYHTNLATYATLFGMPWLEPYMWRFQKWLYNKTILTLCPSPSTSAMLESQNFNPVRLWPRGVELSHFNPGKRSAALRSQWGITDDPKQEQLKTASPKRRTSLPITPPATPQVHAADDAPVDNQPDGRRKVAMYTGRVSWEKNLHLLLRSFDHIKSHLPEGTEVPKLVIVGDGPARQELERLCAEKGIDATFMGHKSGEDLAACYASADFFVFPSFTETFGQVVLEALASGLPVIGLDAEGTRDLVKDGISGLLLPLPKAGTEGINASRAWPRLCKVSSSPTPVFDRLADDYAKLISELVTDHDKVKRMSNYASTQAIKGFTWWDAMEKCVDGYREAMRTTIAKRRANVGLAAERKLSGLRRPISSALAHRGIWKTETRAPTRFIQASFGMGLFANAVVFLALYLVWRTLHN